MTGVIGRGDDESMEYPVPLILTLFLVAMLVGIGVRALSGHGLALTLHRSHHGPSARPLGALLLVAGLTLAAWIALDPAMAAMLWQGPAR